MVDGMRKILWKFVEHAQLTNDELILITKLKEQHWNYGLNSQIDWMKKNLQAEDTHLMGAFEGESEIIAYLSLVHVNVDFDGCVDIYMGLGNVCVSNNYSHCGLGSELVEQANDFIRMNSQKGILLCKNTLIDFYQKNRWILLDYLRSEVSNKEYKKEIMLFPNTLVKSIDIVKIDRTF